LKRGVPASASIDADGFLLKLFKHPHLLQFKDPHLLKLFFITKYERLIAENEELRKKLQTVELRLSNSDSKKNT
jgi:hypothetical protein